jgi:hypothetical protein
MIKGHRRLEMSPQLVEQIPELLVDIPSVTNVIDFNGFFLFVGLVNDAISL